MAYFIFKTIITALIIAGVSEISKRFTFMASLLAALPITSVLIFIWVYIEQKDVQKISTLSTEVFYLVIPSLIFFILLPFLLKRGLGFFPSLGLDMAITFLVYIFYVKVLRMIRPELGI